MSLHENINVVKRKFYKKYKSIDATALLKESWTISWPMMLMMFFEFLMNLTDVYIAGLYSAEVKAATGLSSQVYSFFVMATQALTVGAVATISRAYGAGDNEKFQSAVFTIITSACFFGLILSILGIIFAAQLATLLNAPESVRNYTISLLRVYSFGMFFHIVLINMNAVLRSCKLVKIVMKIMVLASSLNIILNIIFLKYTNIGFNGIALSTVISIFIAFLINSKIIYGLVNKTYKYSLSLIKQAVSIGWPSAIVTFSWQLGGTALFAILGELPTLSVESMAAYTTGLRIEAAIFMPAFAFNMANAIIVGNLIGKKKFDEAFRAAFATAFISVSIVSLITVAVILNAENIANILDPNRVVTELVVTYLYISMISEPFIALNLSMFGALNGAGDTRATMRYAIITIWFVRIPLAYILGIKFAFAASGIWWAMNIGFFVQVFLSTRRFVSRKWQTSKHFD